MTTAIHSDTIEENPAAPTEHTARVRVWDVPTRIFHWMFAATFVGAWLTADSERLRELHVMVGYTFAGLITFRLIWGVIGTRYARFREFLFTPKRVTAYLATLFTPRIEHHTGHNPAGAMAIFAMLALGTVIAISGYATYEDSGGLIEELHEGTASAMLAIVAIHIAGVILSSLLHRENLAKAMITGTKRGDATQGILRNHTFIGALLVAVIVGFWTTYPTGWTNPPMTETTPPAKSHDNQTDRDHEARKDRHD